MQTTLGSWSPQTAREELSAPKLSVRFRRAWTIYFPGDVAGFDERTAAVLVAKRIADMVDVATEGPAPADAVWATRYPIDHSVRGEE